MARPFQQTLISATANVNVGECEARSHHVTPDCPTPWSVRMHRLHGGRQEGVQLVEIDNGRLSVRLIPTRGMNLLDAQMGDVRLGWDSPVGEVVHSAFVDLQERGGLGWIRGFSEYLARCGLEWCGAPSEDAHHHASGEAPAQNLTLHGRISNMPASELELIVETSSPYRIRLRGTVRERMLFGPKLDLQTELSVEPGAETFRIEDRIVNAGSQTEEYGLLYHINHGPPLMEDGARLHVPARHVTPIDQRATEGGVENYSEYGPPEKGVAEQLYLMHLHGDRDHRTRALLRNAAADRGVSLSWSVKQLPRFALWKNFQPASDGYVTGLEPCTNFPQPRPVERRAGRVPKLRAGQSFRCALEFALHDDKQSVKQAVEAVEKIQGNRKPQLDREPLNAE